MNRLASESPKAKISRALGGVFLLGAFVFVFARRFIYVSRYAATWDEADFALALQRFDLLAMQPHFPGYPYFILGGMLFHRWIANPAEALGVFNVAMAALSTIPIYLLARKQFSPLPAGVLALSVQSFAYLWVIGGRPLSEGAAIALLWWYIWALREAWEKRTWGWQVLPLFFFGLLMGTRLSFIPFGLGILLLWLRDWRSGKSKGETRRYRMVRLGVFIGIAIIFQLLWVAGLVLSEGSLRGFLMLAFGFTGGHFQEWGGAISAAELPLWERATRLLFENVLWTGIAARSLLNVLLLAVLVAVTLFSHIHIQGRAVIKDQQFSKMMWWLILAYLVWALIAQNVDKPRHISPMIGPAAFLLFQALLSQGPLQFKKAGVLNSTAFPLKWVLVLLFTGSQIVTGAQWVKEQAREQPAVYQLAEYLGEIPEPLTVYTWEETRVLQYLHVPYGHQRIYTYDLFVAQANERKGERIFLTEQVLRGFLKQSDEAARNTRARAKKIAAFRSEPLFDPVYHEIILYEWISPD